ncbi:MAG: hypothetical protein HY561_13630, partial [Gemmatimonadetes bacterium]|nr:hypothetical protein [Gemmatimonadota bacterium]
EQLVETYDRLAPGDDFHQANHLLFALIYGDSLAQRDARVALDTVQPTSLRRGVVRRILSRADLLPYRETTERRIRASPERGFADAWRLVEALKYRGKVRAALEVLSSDPILLPAHRAESFYALYRMGVFLPAAELEHALTVADADTAIDRALMRALVSGAYAADRRRWAEHQRAVAIARAQAERAHAAADSVTERVALGVAGALEAYGSWRRGRPDEALPTLQRAQQEAVGHAARTVLNEHLRWWLAELNAELGRPQEAIRYLDTLEDDPFFRYRLGALYEELGETEKARAHYAYALTAWAEADPDFAPARQARAALTRLGSDRP